MTIPVEPTVVVLIPSNHFVEGPPAPTVDVIEVRVLDSRPGQDAPVHSSSLVPPLRIFPFVAPDMDKSCHLVNCGVEPIPYSPSSDATTNHGDESDDRKSLINPGAVKVTPCVPSNVHPGTPELS